MKRSNIIRETLLHSKRYFRGNGLAHADDNGELPLRSELFSADQMEQHGRTLAASHTLSAQRVADQLLPRLAENQEVLLETCRLLTEAAKANRGIAPAGEWLLDNFYLIEEQIRTAKRHLPKGYSRELPRLAAGPSAGLPRVYDIALEAISHGDGRIDPESLSRFVAAYQEVTALKLGELWAIPIMLRLALIENLRRVGAPIAAARIYRNQAASWADQMTAVVEKDPKSLILVIADMARSSPPIVSSFVAELARRLQGHGPALALPLTWIEQRLSESNLTIEQLVQAENQQQAVDQVSVSNSIGSLRMLGAIDWREFVETMSVVEHTLRKDPGGMYAGMDRATRDSYRHVVEKIAKHSRLSENEVARKAIQLAHASAIRGSNEHRTAHVGFYLIDRGLRELEQNAQISLSPIETLRSIANRYPLLLYLGAITLITALLSVSMYVNAGANGLPDGWLLLIAIFSVLATSQFAVALVNWLTMLLATPRPLPRVDLSGGIPSNCRTLVVIPTLLVNKQNIEELAEALEVRFLANRDDSLHFGLLTDFPDAPQETLAQDEPLLHLAADKIQQLNRKYPREHDDAFFLFHRPRRWNAQERVWMGYERKRGKLAELNALLRGGARERFARIVGRTKVLLNVKYVITLDTDTQLPRDSARQCVAAMVHPLNRAQFENAGTPDNPPLVSAGYAILQPRVAVSLPGTNRSRFARLCGGEPGIDPYTRAISDVYQDVFGEGSFIGKGIYDVDAFEQALTGRFPENRILSHDLIEGCHARAGLLSDVQLYEDYPCRYRADVSRRHRWIRGDWQIAGWLLPRVPTATGRRRKNRLSALSRWKLFDNLRRSLVPLALTLLMLLAWTILIPAWRWTLAVAGIILIPPLAASLVELLRKPRDVLIRQHVANTARAAGRHLAEAALMLAFLPHEALFSLDAILRTLGRMLITRQRLLEWNPSGELDGNSNRSDFPGYCRLMWGAPVIAVGTALFLIETNPAALPIAAPILLLWLLSPAIAWWISRPLVRRVARLSTDQTIFLQQLARKTWAFFETFVGPQDNWLPPDNYQEYRIAMVAHRTSPTNIGFALLANVAAYDFGYITAGQLIDRSANTLRTMAGLERHRGHFYNWYDTQSLKPLHPYYVSTVDSGNLAASLLALRPGLLALADDRIIGARTFDGLRDTLRILRDAGAGIAPLGMAQFQNDLDSTCDSPPATLAQTQRALERLATDAAQMAASLQVHAQSEACWWAQALSRQCHAAQEELVFLAPWIVSDTDSVEVDEFPGIVGIPSLRQLARYDEFQAAPEIETTAAARQQRMQQHQRMLLGSARARDRLAAIERLTQLADDMASMEYDFLYDKARHLLTIGYNVSERRRDSSSYDLLASEARLACFVGIAQGQLSQESWFALGRLLTRAGGNPVLMSWSGSMFEYLMPLLLMPTYENTLLHQTYEAAVERQIAYGSQRGVPWGMSESGYNTVDAALNYQYRAFGVPGLGFKRGLAEDLVIAPYASVLALMVAPEAACLNLQRLTAIGLEGRYGFYEAIDYTPSRQRRGQSSVIVRSFMAHHQGMNFLSLAYHLLDRPMQKRFGSDPLIQATSLLLQERIPQAVAIHSHTTEFSDVVVTSDVAEMPVRILNTPHTPVPQVQLLSNGNYHVMVTNAGGGYSRWKDLAVTRWREDTTCDNWGSFCYIRDVDSGEFWSTSYQPTLKLPKNYEAIFSEGRAEFRRRDHDFDMHTEIAVSPEDDIELRRLKITNNGRSRRSIEVTSYAEVVLAAPAADALHPTFSNLFVQTEIVRERQAILCHRRPRSREEKTPWAFHLMAVHGADVAGISYETDRMRFIGRGRTVAAPQALTDHEPDRPASLSDSQGSVLDPIVAIRYRLSLDPEQTATIDMVGGVSETRDACLGLVGKYQDRNLADRVFDLAWTHSSVTLRQINATESDAQLYAGLASSIIYTNASMRAAANVLIQNRRGQSSLWGYAISGDLPIVLLQIGDSTNIELVRQLIQAHAYWRLKGLAVDLVIWNEDHSGYRQVLHDQIMGLIAAGVEAHLMDRPAGIFVRRAEQISNEDRILFQTVARAIISDSRGTLAAQVNRRAVAEVAVPAFTPTRTPRALSPASIDWAHRDLILRNGIGGFTPDGREYVITLAPGDTTPTPWVNVLANPGFGSVISESGMANTWGENAHEYRLTPWGNDPISDSSGEAFYLRDEESGQWWSPTPLPCRGNGAYVSRHGFGYSVFEHTQDGIRSELWVYVAADMPIKFSVLKLRNASGRTRRLSATGYVEWVLGDLRSKTALHTVTEVDPDTGALLARNPYCTEFPKRTAFFDVSDSARTVTADRTEFLGRNGTLSRPAAMRRSRLSGKTGAALDPCAALQTQFELADGQEREIVFRLGVGRNPEEARELLQRFRGAAGARSALETVWQYWKHTLGAVQVETPDASINVMTNGWLVYQTLACRLWGRSAFYQPGGAFGFRDQLQDVMALLHAEPSRLRAQLLLAASRQFREGDVQHWWHPPSGRGVRTNCSDDYLWLPLATCRYVLGTGDTGVLDETSRFLEGRALNPGEDSYYDLPTQSEETATLYDHCVRAIRHGLRFGEHGLPLMGAGDWNDGMNLVGLEGKGESVWLGFFLYDVLTRFAEIARRRGDTAFVEHCEKEATQLRQNIEQHAWDGAWYRRAYFDDGTPLGSSTNAECQIDSISQSWAVLSGAADAQRAHMAMDAVDRRLVRREHALVQLLDPPFDKSALDPGYIKGYVPGVRENGGQYTHGAIWTTMAFAALGNRERAWELMSMINPVNHARTPAARETYKVEPYVVAADVYAVAPHIGRGGWTWYTGSAGWMYRLILESLLGVRLEVDRLHLSPCLPTDWDSFKLHYRYRETVYHITIVQGDIAETDAGITVDGIAQAGNTITLVDDRREHAIELKIRGVPSKTSSN